MLKIPQKYRVLFWDTTPENIDLDMHKTYIIERVLEYGDFSADRWISEFITDLDIIEVVKTSRNLSLKTGKLYALKYNLKKEEVECLKNPYTQKQNRF